MTAWYGEPDAVEEARRRAKARRQGVILLVVVNVLVLATAATAAVDLRRLRTPEGTALLWAHAAILGNCDDYLAFSVAGQTRADARTPAELCRDLRASRDPAHSLTTGIRLAGVLRRGHGAEVQIVLTNGHRPVQVALRLVERGGRWRVVRDDQACASMGCA